VRKAHNFYTKEKRKKTVAK